jgi:hypothetical protein
VKKLNWKSGERTRSELKEELTSEVNGWNKGEEMAVKRSEWV